MVDTPSMRRLIRAARGQSLVETALFLPILLFLLAGALEISNMLITQNRVQTAARAATGFGAANVDPSVAITDTFRAMSMVALNNVTQTLEIGPERWDIYTIKATIDAGGAEFAHWRWQRPYGMPLDEEAVFPEDEWEANEAQIKQDILDAFDEANAAGMEIIATVAYHNRDSFLGLDYFNPGLTRIRGLTVMRISETRGHNDGCDLFPIALQRNNLSLYPEDYDQPISPDEQMFDASLYEAAGANLYDDPSNDHTRFPFAQGGHELEPGGAMPRRGDIFQARENAGSAGFAWLSWTGDASAAALAGDLQPPGRLTIVAPAPSGFVNYVNPYDANDRVPGPRDWVQGTTAGMNSPAVLHWVDDHINAGRQIQILIVDDGPDGNDNYRIAGFAQAYLRGRIVGDSDNFLLVEFIKWVDPCHAQPSAYP